MGVIVLFAVAGTGTGCTARLVSDLGGKSSWTTAAHHDQSLNVLNRRDSIPAADPCPAKSE